MSSVRAATLVAALSFSLVRGGVPRSWKSPWPGCDNGKLLIQKDLPRNALWACPATSWPEATQSYPGVDTVYHPEPAKQVCMGTPISYNLTIPNSGPYRPVGAESGEYLYCPAERWLNNLHHGATVLLYHPCAPLSERVRLSVLARSCLSDYIITPHPELEHTEVEAAAKGTNPNDVVATRNYNLLLISPAEQNALPAKQSHANTMLSIRHCCEQSLFNPLVQGEEARGQGGGGGRRPRGAIKKSEKTETTTKHETSPSKSTQTLQASRASESEPNPGLVKPGPEPPWPGSRGRPATTVLGSVLAKTTMAGRHGSDVKGTVEHRDRGSAGQNSAEQKLLTDLPDRTVKNGERVAMKQSREPKLTHPVGIEDKKIAHHRASTPTPTAPEDIVDPDGHIAAGVLGGKGQTPRTDEAVWAAGALGFLLVLLALSVLHTRLYRQWRTTPPMYWHDPRQDYDSVADVIRKRLKIADRRHRRKSYQPRRQECLLLLSSDEEDDDQ
ncbi:tumor protein p53-inducible protein 13 isoform X2 [Gadus morhua]|uniref:tumor protein p53-inducible protein 13 isoform X2 n=1 Tax=Gadus morhua TaxID=8049 RepID=UPI0011B64708|nr:tumor protein p53-inducible protein 13 isoform X2 [Gadus morhua]